MSKPIQIGKVYRIISGAIGPKSKSIGRKGRVVFKHPPPEHTLWGDMYNIETVDGQPFFTDVGIIGNNCDVAGDWLEEDDDTIDPKSLVKELEVA